MEWGVVDIVIESHTCKGKRCHPMNIPGYVARSQSDHFSRLKIGTYRAFRFFVFRYGKQDKGQIRKKEP